MKIFLNFKTFPPPKFFAIITDNQILCYNAVTNLKVEIKLKIFEQAKNFFLADSEEVVGIYYDGEKIFLARLTDKLETLEQNFEIDSAENISAIEQLAEKISVLCSQRGWKTSKTALCLQEGDTIIFQPDFNNIPAEKIDSAVKIWATAQVGENALYTSATIDGEFFTEAMAQKVAAEYFSAWEKNFVEVTYTRENLRTGDLIFREGHVEIFINPTDGSGGAHGDSLGCYINGNGGLGVTPEEYGARIYRFKESVAAGITNVNDTYSITGVGGGTGAGINGMSVTYSNFFFNGIPDGQYSLASRKNIFEIIVNAIEELKNFFSGLLGYLFRGLLIGLISVADRLINNTFQSIEDSPKSLQESGVTATSADDPMSMNRAVTIGRIIFGDVDLFNINIFDVDDDTNETSGIAEE